MRPQTSSLALGITLVALTILAEAPATAVPSRPAPTCVHTPFRGITSTSEIGEVVGVPDPLDWGCANDRGGAAGSPTRASDLNSVPQPPPPAGVCLLPAFPNPATTSVRLRVSLGGDTHVRLVIYGETWGHGPRTVFPVRTLYEAQLRAGEHMVIWDGRDDSGERVPAGVYRAVMEAGADVLCGDIEIR